MSDRFVDIEDAVLELAAGLAGGDQHAGNVTPDDLDKKLPFHRVYRLPGGADDGLTDEALVVVDTFARSRALVWAAAEDLRTLLTHSTRWHRTARGVLDSVETVAAPAATPEQPSGFRRYTATYRATARRRTTA